jgi:bacteriorhodopsin
MGVGDPTRASQRQEVWVLTSAKVSLFAQVVFTGMTVGGVVVDVVHKEGILTQSAVLEFASQIVEFVYYAAVVFYFGAVRTWTRYLDWFVSTPLMLVSFAAFFAHRDSLYPPHRQASDLSTIGGHGRLPYFLAAIVTNAAMLAFGFYVEWRERPPVTKNACILLGIAAFVATFVLLHVGFVAESEDGLSIALLLMVFVIWSGYGAAIFLPYGPKNVMYNTLDVFSKNVYGALLFAYILSR